MLDMKRKKIIDPLAQRQSLKETSFLAMADVCR